MFTQLIDRNTTIPIKKTPGLLHRGGRPDLAWMSTCCRASARWPRTTRRWAASSSTGIAPAPRGVPQIEVTFDIDANGIVHVSAKDLGTGNEQKITITASTNMSEEDIKKAVNEAEQYAAEDKKRKEEVETVNQADSLIYQTEKTMKEMEDKLDPADKAKLEERAGRASRRCARATTPMQIKTAMESFTQDDLRHLRQGLPAAGPQGGEQDGPQGGPQGGAHRRRHRGEQLY